LQRLLPEFSLSEATLLYQKSRDGDFFEDISDLSFNHPNVLVIIRCIEGNIFGGFTSIGFRKTKEMTYSADENAFLFTICNPYGHPPTIFPVSSRSTAVYTANALRWFGFGDLFIIQGGFIHCFPIASGTYNFSSCPEGLNVFVGKAGKDNTNRQAIAEIEIWQVSP
jgi:hypothetical protein